MPGILPPQNAPPPCYKDDHGGRIAVDILLVEDNRGDVRLIEKKIGDGFRLEVVGRLSDALESLERTTFDAVILDLTLPDSEGVETLSRCVVTAPTTPVIVLTGHDDAELGAELMRQGAQDYVPKWQMSEVLLTRSIRHAVERKKIHVQLVESNRLLHEFAHHAGHDMKSPLTRIGGFIDLLEGELGESASEAARDYIGRVQTSVRSMNTLIDDLLEFARLGHVEIASEHVELQELVTEIVEELVATGEDTRVETHDLPIVRGDRGWLASLWRNLLENSVRYSGESGARIEIACESGEESLLFSVRDHGIGVAPDQIDRIFEPFRKLNPSRVSGHGLGLTLCRTIVERHGGRIRAESEGLGSGLTVHFSLPHEVPS